jgi:hypothetical protein
MAEALTKTLKADMGWGGGSFEVSTDFPGGNGIVESVSGDTIHLRPDLRDTEGDWFYWSVRVRHAAGRTLRLVFTQQKPLADRGPALSVDGGRSWRWVGRQDGQYDQCTVTLPPDADDVILSMGMNYTRATWDRFIDSMPAEASIEQGVLTTTRKGRPVPMLRLGRLDGNASYRVLLTARNHACEMMASYVMEGLLAAAVGDDDLGRWFQSEVELLALPMMDTDGVEDGDQGKNRKPRDHNRDYDAPHAHVETAALVERAKRFFDGRPAAFIDMHCPWVHGQDEEYVFQVGRQEPKAWAAQQRFGAILERVTTGPIPYKAADDLPFGKRWNTNTNVTKGISASRWASMQPGVGFATSLEIPYATASGTEVNATTARALGRDLAMALKQNLADPGH